MNRRTTLALTAAAAPALALGLAASTASADPAAGAPPQTVQAVTTAVTTSPATAAVPADGYAVTDVRVTGDVAAATLEPADPAALDPATAVLRLDGGTWTVVDLGTAGVGCDLLTPAQQAGLALTC
ncbi:hypothetical protein [Kineococcus sp. SYSU DK002]|uniref:hypothetical protein n=1 Tax=Kineococcus sp. SYSU DK002 TaxID=3383123 RepID=UPI003D7C43CD